MPDGALVCVYRTRNSSLVSALTEQAREAGLEVHLWALDQEAPALAAWTRGVGPGQRLALLNRMEAQACRGGPLVVADDDVSFSSGSLKQLLRFARRGRLDLCQPAHASDSMATHHVTRHHPGFVARRTRFVEVGPLVVVGPTLRPTIVPFPEEYGMGWGLDVRWADLVQDGWKLGVVDRTTVRHHGPVGAEYDTGSSEAQLSEELTARGLPDMGQLNETLAYWPSRGWWDPRNLVPVWSSPSSPGRLRTLLRRMRGGRPRPGP